MKIHDISWPLSAQTTQYKNRTILRFEPRKTFEKDHARETVITIDSHCGTHVDAPAHFLEHGGTIDQMPLENLIGTALVLDLTEHAVISQEQLQKHDAQIAVGSVVLLKTNNSYLEATAPFNPDFVYLDKTGAQYLAEKKVKAVGIDYLGIERNQPSHDTHTLCMENNITIIEGLRLASINPGSYFFVCLPLLAVGLDGSPARAVLIENVLK